MIAVSSLVWKFSNQKSGNLLLLLAIADHADVRGEAWPGIPLLARKTRLTERHVRRCLNALADAGELEILPNASPAGGTLYRIRLEVLNAGIGTAPPTTVTSASNVEDVDVSPSIREPSEETSLETDSHLASDKILKSPLKPQIEEVLLFASQKKEIDAEVAQIWWHECEACGWIDPHFRPIIKWRAALIAYARKWEANRARQGPSVVRSSVAPKNKPRRQTSDPKKASATLKNGF